jgi:hypothetical protein
MNPEQTMLRIERLPDGGFVVSEASAVRETPYFYGPLFACTDIGEALAYIRKALDPIHLR